MSTKPKGPSAPAPLIKNASAAPFIHFDSVPVYGAFAGSIEVELVARALMPKPDGLVVAEAICTGHLRCTPQAAMALADALEKAVAMHEKRLADEARAAAGAATPVPPADKAA
jgi:hypothetical protein